jgi:molybdopterin-guanine dinucleotide biosynthesis protein A
MDAHRLKIYLHIALKSPDISKACAAVEQLRSALDLLEDLGEPALLVMQEFVAKRLEQRTGSREAVGRAFLAAIQYQLSEVRRAQRREFHNISIVGDE